MFVPISMVFFLPGFEKGHGIPGDPLSLDAAGGSGRSHYR